MPLELVNTLATFGTFLVIAGTAIAALIQLRHARGSNQIAALDELRTVFQSNEFSEATSFLATRLDELTENPAFRYQWAHAEKRTEEFRDAIQRIRLVGNYFEDVGALIVAGLLDGNLTCMIYSGDVKDAWEWLQPLIAIRRRTLGAAGWENFEYAAMLAKKWIEAHPEGTYPRGAPCLQIADKWLEADKQYAASLAPA
jgi:hypothetical protein